MLFVLDSVIIYMSHRESVTQCTCGSSVFRYIVVYVHSWLEVVVSSLLSREQVPSSTPETDYRQLTSEFTRAAPPNVTNRPVKGRSLFLDQFGISCSICGSLWSAQDKPDLESTRRQQMQDLDLDPHLRKNSHCRQFSKAGVATPSQLCSMQWTNGDMTSSFLYCLYVKEVWKLVSGWE